MFTGHFEYTDYKCLANRVVGYSWVLTVTFVNTFLCFPLQLSDTWQYCDKLWCREDGHILPQKFPTRAKNIGGRRHLLLHLYIHSLLMITRLHHWWLDLYFVRRRTKKRTAVLVFLMNTMYNIARWRSIKRGCCILVSPFGLRLLFLFVSLEASSSSTRHGYLLWQCHVSLIKKGKNSSWLWKLESRVTNKLCCGSVCLLQIHKTADNCTGIILATH